MNKLNKQIDNLLRQIQYNPNRKEFYEQRIKETIEYEKELKKKTEDKILKNLEKGIDYIYAVQDDYGCIKIGHSTSPQKRIKALQTANSGNLKIISIFKGDCRKEKRIHEKFKKQQKNNEWFFPSKSLIKFLSDNNLFFKPE